MVGRAHILSLLLIALSLPRPAETAPIRVLLLQNVSTLTVSVPPEYSILTQPAGILPADAHQRRALQVQAGTRSLRLPDYRIEVDEIRLVPRTRDTVIYAGDKPYRGSLEVKWRTSGLMVVNTLDLEEYLYGVVPKEVPTQWEMAALRAQAIVAR